MRYIAAILLCACLAAPLSAARITCTNNWQSGTPLFITISGVTGPSVTFLNAGYSDCSEDPAACIEIDCSLPNLQCFSLTFNACSAYLVSQCSTATVTYAPTVRLLEKLDDAP